MPRPVLSHFLADKISGTQVRRARTILLPFKKSSVRRIVMQCRRSYMSNRKALQICVCVLMIVSVHPYTVAQQRGVDVQPGSAAPRSLLASLHMPASPSQSLAWKRVLPEGSDALDGPVLFALVIRSSATPGSIPKIANNFTLS